MLRPLQLRASRLTAISLRVPLLHRRQYISILSSLPAVLVPPVVFGGLVVSLWAYKCAMMVIFQNKIIYMPGVPPGAKRETIKDYRHQFGKIEWHESPRSIQTSDGKLLSTVTSTVLPASSNIKKHILIVYFQGNASSTPPRLPSLSTILSTLSKNTTATYTFLIPSYRGYWTSTGTPSQAGIERDLSAIFKLLETDPQYTHTEVILWGQSIGCGIALKGWADYLHRGGSGVEVAGLILETPFISMSNMLRAFYPQRWLPYRYLSVFLRSSWDMKASAEVVKSVRGVEVLILSAGRDEVVPIEETAEVKEAIRGMVGSERVRSVVVQGALHVECVTRPQGRDEVLSFLKGFT